MTRLAKDVYSVVGSYDIRGLVDIQIDEMFVFDTAIAFAALIRTEGNTQVVVGYDMRDSSLSFANSFVKGIIVQGLNVFKIGLTSTDQLYFASGLLGCPGAMFTASHNPSKYNGIKLCRADAKPIGKNTGLSNIANKIISGVSIINVESGISFEVEILSNYGDFLRSLLSLNIVYPLKVVVDAGNGMAGLTVPAVLDSVSELTVLPIFFELNGKFPNHEADPLNPSNLIDLQFHVLDKKADMGLAFDGDADRCFFIDELGNLISPSTIIAIVACQELKRKLGTTIVYNLLTSDIIPKLITKQGGMPVRSRVGHSYVKTLMNKTNAIFGGEHSAHYYFHDFWGADSGMIAALYILTVLGENRCPLSVLTKHYTKNKSSGEINFSIKDISICVTKVIKNFEKKIEFIDCLDGITVYLKNQSWFNLRNSNTEPLLRLNVESCNLQEVKKLVCKISNIVNIYNISCFY